jgi:phospholipid/cholesterol/gamma-HCH transport system substrate-binding protein
MVMKRKFYYVEMTVGIFMLLGILALMMLAYKVSSFSNYAGKNGYLVSALFDNVGDLKIRAPVTVAGVRVGYVKAIKLDPKTYRATVELYIHNRFSDLPMDTSATILTAGLLGANYICLEPGYAKTVLRNGDTIKNTNSALILENLIGQLLFKVNNNSSDSKKE